MTVPNIPFLQSIKDPKVLARVMPYAQTVHDEAIRVGVDPNFAFAQLLAESGGRPDAVSAPASKTDPARDRGLWQVNDKTKAGWGFGVNDTRMDPIASTKQIMPHLKVLSDKYGGNWAHMRNVYMRWTKDIKRLQAGELPDAVLGNSPIALAQFKHFEKLQSQYGGKNVKAAEDNLQEAAPSTVVPRDVPLPGYLTPESVDSTFTAGLPEYQPVAVQAPIDPFASVYPAEAAALAQQDYDAKIAADNAVLVPRAAMS
jgi:Transglycosylase SLT domain